MIDKHLLYAIVAMGTLMSIISVMNAIINVPPVNFQVIAKPALKIVLFRQLVHVQMAHLMMR